MHKFDNNIHLSVGRSSLASAFFIIAIFFLGFQGVGAQAGLFIAQLFYDGDLLVGLTNASEHPDVKYPAYILQSIAAIIGLIIIPYIYLKVREQRGFSIFFKNRISIHPLLITPMIVISSMVVLSVIIAWNAQLTFPDFLSELETDLRASEDRLAELTTVLTSFDSFPQFLIGLVVVAIIPSIGEEIVFRGLLQNELRTVAKNPHIAIWVSAAIFSAIHLQFFGFFPRLLLGALFGYLYYWSGNLIIPILAHFINNGFSLLLTYMATGEAVFGDIENTESATWPSVLIFLIIAVMLLYYFRNYFLTKSPHND